MKDEAPLWYVLIDPPVSPFSPPDKIRAWIETLRSWEPEENFQDEVNRANLVDSLREAEDWLVFSTALHDEIAPD